MQLSVYATKQYWAEGSWETLLADTASRQAASELTDISDLQDLQMLPNGMVPGPRGVPYHLSSMALKQVCKILCPGLYQTLSSLSGQSFIVDDDPGAYSVRVATEVYNKVLGLRFASRFGSGYQALWNLHEEVLEGVLGTHYVAFPNQELLSVVDDTIATVTPTPVFQEAWRRGRRLIVRCVCELPLFATHSGDRCDEWHAGLHFENSETGESSVRIFPLLWHSTSGGYVLDVRRSWHVPHTGSDFRKRLRKTIQVATERYRYLDDLREPLQKLAGQPFPVHQGQIYGSPVMAKLLQRLGLGQTWLTRVLRQIAGATIMFGGLHQPDVDILQLMKEAGEQEAQPRTNYDFLLQTLYAGLRHDTHTRMELEDIAKLIIVRLTEDESSSKAS